MITIRIEFYNDKERLSLLEKLQKDYEFIEESAIKDTKKKESKLQLQFIKIVSR